MKTFKLDGLEFEIEDNLMTILEARSAELTSTKADLTKQTARADKAEEALAEAIKKSSKEEISQAVTARVELVRTAEKVLPANHGLKLDTMDDGEIMKQVVLTVSPSAKEKVEKGDAAYTKARFDAIVEDAADEKKPNSGLALVRGAGQRLDVKPAEDGTDSAREKMIIANRDAYKAK